MSAARLLGVLLCLAYLVAVVGIAWMLRRERKRPTSYTRSPEYLGGEPSLAEWRGMTTAQQEEYDNAVLDAQESAQEAVRRAGERAVEEASRVNALHRF